MAPRASSPALSENEFDIGAALLGSGNNSDAAKDIGLHLGDESVDGSDDEAFIAATQAASNRKASNLKGKTVKKGGGFQAMGLNAMLLKAISGKGFNIPTPIQRKAVPLILDRQDVVGMARTGSGKTAAFVIPMIQNLKAHSAKFGARAVIMSPSRELALQTLKVVKDLGRGTDLRTVLLVGGDSLDEQFSSMTSNPDIIIATPGRLLHLKVEMDLDLSSVRYIVFDEADRLFEMGFAVQLTEILHSLPPSRQTLLFSATLPKTLVEFARAGLQEPKLIRLDDSKISPDLESAFFAVKSAERDAALLYLLEKVVCVPSGTEVVAMTNKARSESNDKKRKRGQDSARYVEIPTPKSTIVFAATKHRVEYLTNLLKAGGYSVSYVYGSLDQTARRLQVQDFRDGLSNILVVTDVAARGLDLPYLANVINYDFPPQPKIFVHRVGRTARAGRKGWSYSLIREIDVPYLIDLQLFLGRPLICGANPEGDTNFASDVVVGSFIQDELQTVVEAIGRLHEAAEDLFDLQTVAAKGEAEYLRSRNSASSESVKRAKQLLASRSLSSTHALFQDRVHTALEAKERMLERISSFRPTESIFEIGVRGTGSIAAEIMRKRRSQIEKSSQNQLPNTIRANDISNEHEHATNFANGNMDGKMPNDEDSLSASDSDELEITISQPDARTNGGNVWQNSDFFMSYEPKGINAAEERGYGVHSGSYNTAQQNSNFLDSARAAQMDLTNDERRGFAEPTKARGMRWDKKAKKYVAKANDEDGSKGSRMITGESGLKIAASFRSGRFDQWRKSNKVGRLPRVGELEAPGSGNIRRSGQRYKHNAEKTPKAPDRFRDDYYTQKKKIDEAKQKRLGKFKDNGAKSEVKGAADVQKQRQQKEKRREKNARPSKRRKS